MRLDLATNATSDNRDRSRCVGESEGTSPNARYFVFSSHLAYKIRALYNQLILKYKLSSLLQTFAQAIRKTNRREALKVTRDFFIAPIRRRPVTSAL